MSNNGSQLLNRLERLESLLKRSAVSRANRISKAATGDDVRQFVTFQKVGSDDERTVLGKASSQIEDEQGDVVTPEAIAEALPDFMRWANMREMHQPSAVGVFVKTGVDEETGKTEVQGRVVDDAAWKKVKSGVYKGFSIGGKVVEAEQRLRPDGTPYRVITKLKLHEISLVDRPANPEAVIELWKGANLGMDENDLIKDAAAELDEDEETELDEVEESEDEEEEEDGDLEESEEEESEDDEDEEEEESEDEDEDEDEETDKAMRGGPLSKAGSKAKSSAKGEDDSEGEDDEDEDPDGDGDTDEGSIPEFILATLQAMRSAAEKDGDLDSARVLGTACTALAAHRVGDPAEKTPAAPGHKPNKMGGTSVPAGKEGDSMAGHGASFFMAQQISDLVKATYGGTNAGTGSKGVKVPTASKTNPANMKGGAKSKRPKGSALTSAGAVGSKSPGATGMMNNARKPGLGKPGGTFSHGSVKASGGNGSDDLQKAYFETLTKTLEGINDRLGRIEQQPTDGGPVLRGVEKSLSVNNGGKGGKLDKVAALNELAAQENDPYVAKELRELAAKAELRGIYNFQN